MHALRITFPSEVHLINVVGSLAREEGIAGILHKGKKAHLLEKSFIKGVLVTLTTPWLVSSALIA
jgi:fluoride ion exporter CrcB/FEX